MKPISKKLGEEKGAWLSGKEQRPGNRSANVRYREILGHTGKDLRRSGTEGKTYSLNLP